MKGHSHAFLGALQPTSPPLVCLSVPPILNLSISHLAFVSGPLASLPSRALITSPTLWHPVTGWPSLPDTWIFSSFSLSLSFFFFDSCCNSLYHSLYDCSSPLISCLPFNPHRHFLAVFSGFLFSFPPIFWWLAALCIVFYSLFCHSYIRCQCQPYLWLFRYINFMCAEKSHLAQSCTCTQYISLQLITPLGGTLSRKWKGMKTSLGESECWAHVVIPLWPIEMALILVLLSYTVYCLLIMSSHLWDQYSVYLHTATED